MTSRFLQNEERIAEKEPEEGKKTLKGKGDEKISGKRVEERRKDAHE